MSTMKLDLDAVKTLDVSHLRCDGTVNVYIELTSGQAIELFGLTNRQACSLETVMKRQFERGVISLDTRFLVQTEELWMSQNGISSR